MNLIKAVKGLFSSPPRETVDPKVYLRRGPLEKIQECKPSYVGEIVLCTDHPSIYVWAGKRWEEIPIDEAAQLAFLAHYGDRLIGEWLI